MKMGDKKYNSTAVLFTYIFVAASIVVLLDECPLYIIAYGCSGLWAGYYIGVCQPRQSDGE